MKKVVIVGGGPAGMMAAIQSAKKGHDVTLLEKNEKLGKKLFITGKGRCNITNACDVSDLFSNVISNPKFLYSSFYGFSNEDMISFIEDLGLKIKVERGGRVFPASDKSSDVIKVLQKECEKTGVKVRLNTKVKEIMKTNDTVSAVELEYGERIEADAVILATGGISYSSTGSTGDGFHWAKKLGHKVTELRSGLVGMTVKENVPKVLQGLTLKNIELCITKQNQKKVLYQGFGELLFTHYGVSGPLMLSASSQIGDMLRNDILELHIDVKPALSEEQLDQRILRDFEKAQNADIQNAMIHLLPKSMIQEVLKMADVPLGKKVHQLKKEDRKRIVGTIKDMRLTLNGLRGIEEAIITRGGVCVNEVDPGTMESKLVKGLYFAGEILDLDALTGGFNLQIAWSTGYAAGTMIED